jgi:hypothetical protein
MITVVVRTLPGEGVETSSLGVVRGRLAGGSLDRVAVPGLLDEGTDPLLGSVVGL